MRVKIGLLARYSIYFLNSSDCFFICFLLMQSFSKLRPYWGRCSRFWLIVRMFVILASFLKGFKSLIIIIINNRQLMEEGENAQIPKKIWKVALGRPFFILMVIIVTSWLVYDVNVNTLEHTRNFTRMLNYHVLRHQTIGVYWFGQQMLNYPIHQFYLLTTFQDFLKNMHSQMGDLQSLSYCLVDQQKLNATKQQIIVQRRGGTVQSYGWYLQKGPQSGQPFSFDDIVQIKNTFIDSHSVQIKLQPIDLGNGNIWNINFLIQPFSDTSIFVTFLLNQDVSLAKKHILHFVLGCMFTLYLVVEYITKRPSFGDNFLNYFLAMFLVLTSILAFSDQYKFQFVFILDGITCLSAWLCALKFYTKGEDYKLSFLLNQSYGMIGRLFASFGPLLIAFSIFAYCVFSRYSGQFSSFWRTFTSLFYICYYNMTYQSSVVTGRSNPISMIFFITFVLLFTICIYSSMLVSVFCSYVWGKREEQIKKDIVANLKIQCSSCDHKYKYSERSKIKPKKSFNLSEFLQVNWSNQDEVAKYKRVMSVRISRLRERAEQCINLNEGLLHLVTHRTPIAQSIIEDFWKKLRNINNIVEQEPL